MRGIESLAIDFEEACRNIEYCDDQVKLRELLRNLPAQKDELVNAIEFRFNSYGEIPE